MRTPDWVKDAVFYQIFPDRFAQSRTVDRPSVLEPWDSPPTRHGFKGGDLVGIAEHLDYLEGLGVTALYLNPIFQSTANHRYHTTDYYRVDPLLGGDGALRVLLDAAHGRGMRIILDGVFNHTGRGFHQFAHLLENGPHSPYADWFEAYDWPLNPYDTTKPANYRAWWANRELPELNTNLPAVREFLWGVAEHWIGFGVDGWRLDVPNEIDDDAFWCEFRRRVKQANPEAYVVGEIWRPAQRWLQGDQFDAVMNYPFSRACLGFVGGRALDTSFQPGGFKLEPLSAQAFAARIEEIVSIYDWEVVLAQLNLLGSHDTARFLTMVGHDVDRLKLAVLCQMTFPGAPCIYYGDEVGLRGGDEPASRAAFPWDESRWDADLLSHVRRCIRLRHDRSALRRGRYEALYAHRGAFAFLRQSDREALVVALNSADEERYVHVPVGGRLPDGSVLHDVWSGEPVRVSGGRLSRLWLAPLAGRVLGT